MLKKTVTMETLSAVRLLLCVCVVGDVCSFLLEDGEVRCPDSVTSHRQYVRILRDKCFEFVIYQKRYWDDARKDCMRKGGDLAIIPDDTVQTFIMDSLVSLGNREGGLWIGLTDKQHELHWTWVTGQPLQGYNNWAHRQGGANALHLTQDCAQIRTDDHGKWHDRECHLWLQRFAYICEYDAETVPHTFTVRETTQTTTTRSTTTPAKPTTTTATSTSVSSTTKPTTTKIIPKIPTITETSSTTTATTQTTLTDTSTTTTTPMKTRPPQTRSQSSITTVHPHSATTNPGTLSSLLTTARRATTTETYTCKLANCSEECLNGYSGLFVDLNGCVECNCN